jgi:cell division protein FtsW (lipid II flippase)
MIMEIILQSIGWVGTFLIVVAYFLVSYKKIDPGSHLYQTMNLLGAIGVGVNVFQQQAWPAVALQVIWGIIALIALIKRK